MFFQLMPTPKWKLVVDVGAKPPKPDNASVADRRVADLLKLLAEHIPTHRNSPYSPYLPGFTSLRLLLLKQTTTSEETDLLTTVLQSYSSYLSSGRSSSETAWMIARDFMLLSRTSTARPQQQQGGIPPVPQQQQQSAGNHLAGQPGQQAQLQMMQSIQPMPGGGSVQQLQQASRLLQSQPQTGMTNQHQSNPSMQQLQQNAGPPVPSNQQELKPSTFLHLQPGYGAAMNGGATPQQNSLTNNNDPSNARNLAPSPGFSLQQSAFHPISQTPGAAPQQSNVGA